VGYITINIKEILRIMAVDLGNSALQLFLDIMYLIVLYIAKVGFIIGLMYITEKMCKAVIDRSLKIYLHRIMKGLALVILSLTLYLILI
jgi:hypothetical protein